MMKIEISERLQPFTHQAGALLLIPGTDQKVQIFPTRIVLSDRVITLPFTGPVEQFTVMMDLEREKILVWGTANEGYFHYVLHKEGFFVDRDQTGDLKNCLSPLVSPSKKTVKERLSLGCHKKQEWDQIVRRSDLKEILPHWLRLGTLTKSSFNLPESLSCAVKALEKRDGIAFYKALHHLFRARFKGVLVPDTKDDLFQGILEKEDLLGTEIGFLTEGAGLIRRAFVDENKILPCLPPQFPCGRLLETSLKGVGLVDLEWSKKFIRRMVIRCDQNGSTLLRFQPDIRQFRLRRGRSDQGVFLSVEEKVHYKDGDVLFFDRFTK